MAIFEDDEQRVAGGYDAVYAALPHSPTFARMWREHALGADYPEGFEHISFLTLAEMQCIAEELRIEPRATLLDLGCGMGGPGLWIAREAGAQLIGVDLSEVALRHASARAEAVGMPAMARFQRGSFADTRLAAGSIDAAMSVDALQYAPDKQAAFDEAARVLRAGGRLVFVCFELDEERVRGLPVLGTDPLGDYRASLEQAGFDVELYEETGGWRERVTGAYSAAIDAQPALVAEMGEAACGALLGEMRLTLQIEPYRRRVMVVAAKR